MLGQQPRLPRPSGFELKTLLGLGLLSLSALIPAEPIPKSGNGLKFTGRQMAKQPDRAVPAPTRGNEVASPLPASDPMHLHQTMLEVHKELSANSAKLERAIQDLNSIESKVESMSSSFNWFRGFFAAAAILIPGFIGIVWWLIGAQITDLKNEILKGAPVAQAPPAQQKPK
jgi:hypothetical protein